MAKSGTARPKIAIGAALGMAVIFGVSGCATPGTNPVAEPTVVETEIVTVTDAPVLGDTEPTADPAEFSDAPRSADAASAVDLVVTDIAVTTEDDQDQVALTMSGSGAPGYRVEFVDQAVQDGSGFVHETGDGKVLLVTLTGMTFPMDVDATEVGVSGAEFGGREVVKRVIYDAWFEGSVRVFVVLDPDVVDPVFTVARGENPSQVLINVAPADAVSGD